MNDPKFEINVLPAAHGDCIHLRFWSEDEETGKDKNLGKKDAKECSGSRWYNVVIDSGPEEHCDGFAALMSRIREKNEQVDLLCFTHMDDDHIEAAEEFLAYEESAADLIRKIWINIPESEIKKVKPVKPGPFSTVSAATARNLYSYILGHGIPCVTCVTAGMEEKLGDVTIRVAGPTVERLKKAESAWAEASYTVKQVSTEQVSRKRSDSSVTNGASIVLAVSDGRHNLLFCADAFAVELTKAVKELGGGGFDLVKLPHHGSEANITHVMLNHMNCRHFVISTKQICDDKNEVKRPSQTTVDYLSMYAQRRNTTVVLYGNYPWKDIQKKEGVRIEVLTEEKKIGDAILIRTEDLA